MIVLKAIFGFLFFFILNHIFTFVMMLKSVFSGFYVRRPKNFFCLLLHVIYSVVFTPVLLAFIVLCEAIVLAGSPIAVLITLLFGKDKSDYGTRGIVALFFYVSWIFNLILILPELYSEPILNEPEYECGTFM